MSAWNRFSFKKLGLGLASLTFATVAASANAATVSGAPAGLYKENSMGAPAETIASAVTNVTVSSLMQNSSTECTIRIGNAPLTWLWDDASYLYNRAGFTSGDLRAELTFDPTNGLPSSFVLPNHYSSIPNATMYSSDGGSNYSIAGALTITVSASELSSFSDYAACIGAGSSSSSSSGGGSSSGSASTASATVIQSDVARVTRSAVTANNSMMSQGLERFIGDRESGMSLTYAISTSGLDDVVWSSEIKSIDETLFGTGSFFGQSVSADGIYRRVTVGEVDLQHELGAGTTLSLNGRMAWERAAGEDSMVAYFLGAEVNRSNIEGSYTGDQNRYGITGGMYGFKELDDNLYLSGYGSLGVARSSLNITNGGSTPSVVTGDYTSRTFSLGGQISGSVEYETYELRPSVSLNYVKTWVGDITLDENGSPINVSVGDTTFAELIASPEFLFPMEQQEGSNMVTVASAAPRLICERSDAASTVTNECGAGLELGINGTSEDGATNLNASIRFDRVGGVDRQGLNLQAEFRF